MMQTECAAQNMDGYIFGLTCLSESGPQRHVFGPESFADEEVFDTLIPCEECRPDSGRPVPGTSLTTPAPQVPTTPPATHLAGAEVNAIPTTLAPAHTMAWSGPPPSIHELVAEVTEMKADLKIVEAKVVQLSNAVLTTPSPTVAPASLPVVATAQAARVAHPSRGAARHAGSSKASHVPHKVVLQRAHRSRHVAQKSLRHRQRVEEQRSSNGEDDSEEDARENADQNEDDGRDDDVEGDDERADLERDDDESELGREPAAQHAKESSRVAENVDDGDDEDVSGGMALHVQQDDDDTYEADGDDR